MAERNLECKVCGKEFSPILGKHKVVKTASGAHYDTFDCPRCGCQVVAQRRIVDGDKTYDSPEEKPLEKVFSVMDIIYEDREDATDVFSWVQEIFNMCHCITVADYYELTNICEPIPCITYKYGWENIDGMAILKHKNGGWILHMPPAKKLDVKEQ